MWKSSIKNKMANNTSEQVAAAGTDSDTKFKWPDDFVEDLRCLALLFHNNISLLVFSDIDNR